MDKFVTFIGYLQSFVVPSRRNQSRERASDSSETRNHATNEAYLPPEKSHPRTGQNIGKGPSGKGVDSKAGSFTDGAMEEADGSSEKNGVFLRSEVEETRTPGSQCKTFVDNEQPKRFGNAKIENCRSRPTQRQISATSPEKLRQSVKKQTSLPSYSAARGLPHDQMIQQKTKEDNRGNKDLQGRNGLPDIHSTEGKPLVQLRQPSIRNAPIRRRATPVLAVDTLSFDRVKDDWMCPQNDQTSGLKLPKLKKKKKKKKRKDLGNSQFVGQSEQGGMAGEKESRIKNPVEKDGKLCAGKSKCEVAALEKLSEERDIENRGERNVINGREHQIQQRPRTALGRWLKKRSNSVAPAPFDDVISDARDDGSKKAEIETGTYEEEDGVEKESRALNGINMAEELTPAYAPCYVQTNQSVQTSQSGVKSRLHNGSLGAPTNDDIRDCDGLNTNFKGEHSGASSNVAGRGKRDNGQPKQLITLELKSEVEAPTVSKKDDHAKPGKTIFVKERVERTSGPLPEKITKQKEKARLSTESRNDLGRLYHEEQGAAGGAPDDSAIRERPKSSFLKHGRPARRPSTFLQQFKELTKSDCSSAGVSEPPPPLPDCKPKWLGAAPCLPAIMPEKKQYGNKEKLELEDDFEGWGEPEPADVKRILERPISVKLPRYPAHWDPLPNERPPGRGGQGYCLGAIWKKPKKSALSDSSCDDITHKEEETYACATAVKRADTPRKNLFVDPPYPEHDQSKVKEPDTWCRLKFGKSFCLNPPIKRAPEEIVDIEDVE